MNWKFVTGGAVLLFVLLMATSSESLWSDEGDTAYYAIQPTFSAWKSHLLSDPNADCQFPLYMLSVWSWARVFGSGEYALRSMNALLAILAVAAFGIMGRQLRLSGLWAILLIQPFFWFYLNEARPYMFQIAAGSLLLAGFVLITEKRPKNAGWLLLTAGTICLYYSTLLSFVTLGALYAVLLVLVCRKQIELPHRWLAGAVALGVLLLPGTWYYISTVFRGAGGARIWPVSPLNFLWVYYEISGGVGLGPPVWQLREIARDLIQSGVSVENLYPLFWPGALGLCIAGVFALAFLRCRKSLSASSCYFPLTIVLGTVFAAFVLLSVSLHKAFWARHLAPVFPFYAFLLYLTLAILWKAIPRTFFSRFLVIASLVLLVASSGVLVVSDIHAKDDNRNAARMAADTLKNGGSVWWAASWHCGAYYGLPISNSISTSERFDLLQSPVEEVLLSKGHPDLILVSRPDVYDEKRTIERFVRTHSFDRSNIPVHLFSIWKKAKP